jgi:F-type H+-transporting ATPase subunit epsilon
MADTLELEVATPERLLVHDQVSEVQVPAKDGYVGILPGHAALLAELGTGFMSYSFGAGKRYLSIHGGFMEVLEDHVRVLATAGERAEEIDVERARRALERAQEQLVNPALGVDPAAALGAMARAQARLEAAARK